MTIALGILATDGVVLAADTEESYSGSEAKGTTTKVIYGESGTGVSSAVAGAGYAHYVDAIRVELLAEVMAVGPSRGEQKRVIESRVSSFYKQHVKLFLPYPDAPHFDLLIGVHAEGSSALWATSLTAARQAIGFELVGSGAVYARMLLNNLNTNMDVASATILACHAVLITKNTMEKCGKGTQVVLLMDGAVGYLRESVVDNIERTLGLYSLAQDDLFNYISGITDDMKTVRKRARSSRIPLDKIRQSIRHRSSEMFQT
jgi:20S proteasome alpha/beta subunit